MKAVTNSLRRANTKIDELQNRVAGLETQIALSKKNNANNIQANNTMSKELTALRDDIKIKETLIRKRDRVIADQQIKLDNAIKTKSNSTSKTQKSSLLAKLNILTRQLEIEKEGRQRDKIAFESAQSKSKKIHHTKPMKPPLPLSQKPTSCLLQFKQTCNIQQHIDWQSQIQDYEIEKKRREEYIVLLDNRASEEETNNALLRDQIMNLEQQLAKCPNPDKVDSMNARLFDLQQQIMEYQKQLKNTHRRPVKKNTQDADKADKVKKLEKQLLDLEFQLLYGESEKDNQIQNLKSELNQEYQNRLRCESRVSDAKYNKKLNRFVEEWLFDKDIAQWN